MKTFTIMVMAVFVFCMSMGSGIAATQDDFNLTILKDNNPVREFNGKVAIPFDTEYKLRLKNDNSRRCVATVYIDGAKVSEMGDFIINAIGYLDLERFLDKSLTEGKRFKFVPLTHPDVDDPSRAENGVIKVEFRLERQYIILEPQYPFPSPPHYPYDLDIEPGDITVDSGGTLTITGDTLVFLDSWEMDRWASTQILTNTFCSTTSAGATIPGSHSDQTFHKVDFEAEDKVVVIQLKMVGI